MFNIYTHVHFDSRVSVQLPTVVSGQSILLKFDDLFAVICSVAVAEFCENQIWFGGFMKMCSFLYFSPWTQCTEDV